MTTKMFLKKLAQLPKRGWQSRITGSSVRLVKKRIGWENCYCPVVAVHDEFYGSVGAKKGRLNAWEFGRRMCLQSSTIDRIVTAADDYNHPTVRKWILASLGLERKNP